LRNPVDQLRYWRDYHTNRDKVFELLKGTNNGAERDELMKVYQRKYGHSLEEEYEFLSGSDKDKFQALLNKKDGHTPSQNADSIKAALDEEHELTGRRKDKCEQDIRDSLRGMTSQQIEEMDKHYRATYHTSL